MARLQHLPELAEMCQALEPIIPRPYVTPWHRLPDLPNAALIRTLTGHSSGVTGCAFSPSGDTIVSAALDNTLKLWDAHTGQCMITLPVNGALLACAFHPDGEHIVAAGGGGLFFLRVVK